MVDQLNRLKLISQNDDKLNELSNYDDTCSDNEEQFSSENNSIIQEEISLDHTNNYSIFEKEFISSTKLSDIVKNKLLYSKTVNNITNDYNNNTNISTTNINNINNNNNGQPSNFSFQNNNFLSEEDTILIDELVKDSLVHSTFIYSSNGEFSHFNNTIIADNISINNINNSSNNNMAESVPNSADCLTQDEIDGIKEILSQDC